MNSSDYLGVLVRLLRTVLLVNLIICIAVAILYMIIGWQTINQYGDLLVKVGILELLVVVLIGLGGISSRGQDFRDFSLTRAVRMDHFLANAKQESRDRVSLLITGIISAVITLVIGSILMAFP